MTFKRVIILAATSLCLANCTSENTVQFITTTTYVCEDQSQIIIKWSADVASVSFDEKEWLLKHAISASGARYTDGQREIWEHHNTLRWTTANGTVHTCK
jgi:membrane-bound inhibitor of C-type lysozyme